MIIDNFNNSAPDGLTAANKLLEAYFAENNKAMLYWLSVLANIYGIEPQLDVQPAPLAESVLALTKAIRLTFAKPNVTIELRHLINNVLASLAKLER